MWNKLLETILGADRALSGVFDWVNNLIRNSEYSFANMVTAIIPYTTLLIPAIMTYNNVRGAMEYSEWLAIVTGFNVAGIGIALGSTFFAFLLHQRRNVRGKKADKLPKGILWAPVLLYIFYFGIVITVNVWLHTQPGENTLFYGNLALTMLEVPAVLIATMRILQTDILKSNRQQDGKFLASSATYDYRIEVKGLPDKEKLFILDQPKSYFEERWPNHNPDTVRKWKARIRKELGL